MGGLLGFVIGRHLQDQHNADLNAQKNILDMYSNVLTDPSHADPEVNRQALANYVDLLRKKPGDFRNQKMMDRVKGDLENWTEMNQAAKGRQPAPSTPPTQSLASQGPPSAQATQVPPPPDAGGSNYGPFAGGPPSAVMGQMVAPSQPASQAMSAIAPPDIPPPPGMEAPPQAAVPAAAPAPLTADALAFNPFRSTMFKKKAESDLGVAAKVAEEQAKNQAEFERFRNLSAFNRSENEALMKRMREEGGGAHIYTEMGVNGQPSIKIDPGVLSSRPVAGKDLLDSNPDMKDKYGKPLDPLKFYDMRQFTRAGGEEVMPTSVPPIVRIETPDPSKPAERFIVARDRLGTEVYREPYAPNAAFAPLVRSTSREQIIDVGNKKISVPVTSTNTSQRVLPGQPIVAPPPAAGGAPAAAPRNGAPTSSATPRGAGRSWDKALGPTQVLPMKNSIEVASHQLWGDPDNPSLRPLASYANLADDQGARQRLGQALRMVLDAGGDTGAEHLGASAGPVSFSAGNLGTALSYNLGIPQAAADAKATALRDIFAKMKPEEIDYFNSLMNAIPTITGFRKLTSGGAFRWSQQGLERELPMIGLSGVTNSATYAKKMAALGDEPLTAIKNLERTNPGVVDPRLTLLIKGGGRGVAPSGPPAAGVPAVGTIMKGYKFKGGNPADQSSWEKVP